MASLARATALFAAVLAAIPAFAEPAGIPPGANDVKGYLLGALTKMEQASEEFLANAVAYQKLIDGNGGDPVKAGLVESFNRPGGNVTGVTTINAELGSKWLSLVGDLVPRAVSVAFLSADSNYAKDQKSQMLAAARALGRQIIILETRGDREYEMAFKMLVEREAGALIVGPFPFRNIEKIVTLAARYKIPTIYPRRDYVDAGGLMSYAADYADTYRQAGVYAGRILRGAKPSELPVMQATKFELVINLKTAQTLGIEVPSTLLALADEVIE